MGHGDAHEHLVAREDPQLYGQLAHLATNSRMVFFAGLPGTGKSLLVHQLAHLAHAAGQEIHLLQWDVVRPLFEASQAGARHPIVDGVTDSVIRKAAGGWARDALVRWHTHHLEATHLLIGETPLVGHRFIELARRVPDAAEPLLTATSCRFVIPVPSQTVRQFLEVERDRRIRRPKHDREREDAPPDVLRALWEQLADVGRVLGVRAVDATAAPAAYDPILYERVYRLVLKHRHAESLVLEKLLSSDAFSVYEFDIPTRDVVPTPDETDRFIERVEQQYPDREMLRQEIDRWYTV